MNPMHNIIIIGAGITGACAAYLLSKQGLSPTVIDAHTTLSPASFCNPGGLNPLHGPGIPGNMAPLSVQAYRMHQAHWSEVQQLSGIDFFPRKVKRLILAFNQAEIQALRQSEKLYQAQEGFSAQYLTPSEALAQEPRLSAEISGALFTEGNLSLDARAYRDALLQAALKWGAKLYDDRVVGLNPTDKLVECLLESGARLSGQKVLLTTGAWSELWQESSLDSSPKPFEALSPLMSPLKGELLRLENHEAAFAFDLTWGIHGLYHHRENQYWLGGSRESRGFDLSPQAKTAESILAELARVLPAWQNVSLKAHCAGLRPASFDGRPLIGALSELKHRMGADDRQAPIWLASGAGPKGMLWSMIMAELSIRLLTQQLSLAEFQQNYPQLSLQRLVAAQNSSQGPTENRQDSSS